VRFHLDADSRHDVVAFAVDRVEPGETTIAGLPLVELDELVGQYPHERTEVFVAVGYRRVNCARAEVYERVKALGYRLLTYVSPHAIVAAGVQLGDNCFVFEGVIVQPATYIGCDTILRSGAVIGHDCVIGDHCYIAPSASISGNAVVGDFSFVGNNATIRDGVEVAPRTVIGAGALIMRHTRPGEIYVGKRTSAVEGRDSSELDHL
jgi:sugar O-acyltransferase (sialic acid O-acetyltransferase NeuD family)